MTKNATLVALVVFALAAAATAAFVDDGMLYVVGKTERKSQLQFYGFEIPGGFPVHNFDWFYPYKHEHHSAHHHEDLIVTFNQKKLTYVMTDNQGMLEIRANKPKLLTLDDFHSMHGPRNNHYNDSCIVALEYDRVCRKAILVTDWSEEPDTLEFFSFNPSNGNTKYLCSSNIGHVSLAKYGVHTLDPLEDRMYYTVGDEDRDSVQLITYSLEECSVQNEPHLQVEHIVGSNEIDGQPQHMHRLLSLDFSEVQNALIAMMTVHDESVILAKIYPTSGRIMQLGNFTQYVEGFHPIQGVTFMDYEHHLHFSIWLEDAEVVLRPVDRYLGKHEEWEIKIRIVAMNIETGEYAFHFDHDVNHSFIPRGMGFAPKGGRWADNHNEL